MIASTLTGDATFMNQKGDLNHPVADYLRELVNEIP